MKNGMIFARKSTWRSRLDLEYLDETSCRKTSQQQETVFEKNSGRRRKLKQFGDYASKETLGQVHAGGFLHHLILENEKGVRTAPSQQSNTERKKRIAAVWFAHLRKFPTSSENSVIQHRLVFSMSREFHDQLVEKGVNPDHVLHSSTKRVMQKFSDRFHAGDSIGYAFGIHHDTDNLHVHVALCPRTKKGAYVGCSMSSSSSGGHKNQMVYLRSCFAEESRRWAEVLNSSNQLEKHLSRRLDAEMMVITPPLSHRQMVALRHTQTGEAIRLQQSYQSIRNLEIAIAVKRKVSAAKRNSRFALRLLGTRTAKLTRTAEQFAAVVDSRSLREMQRLLFKIKRDYRVAHKRYSKTYGFQSYAHRNSRAQSPTQQQKPSF